MELCHLAMSFYRVLRGLFAFGARDVNLCDKVHRLRDTSRYVWRRLEWLYLVADKGVILQW